ncbi:MGMT family protein [Pedobacter helvus]|uniref:MGMT family protein n=1 Tax=Pedobacter helvus TaxID=2563444 RepID=A0ABW9JI83_9SPHI|nr:MGMT family protein [Pedobacter ureilyticus]
MKDQRSKSAKAQTSTFYEQVYEVARLVPKGRVTSYGAIAKALGVANSSRMVGHAMAYAGQAYPKVPAHRIVNSSGLLTGRFHFSPPTLMQELLEKEGVTVVNDKVKNFKQVFWDPLQEL